MNLHAIASGAISAVNPQQPVSVQISAGTYTTSPNGARVPQYQQAVNVYGQVQELTTRDLRQLDSLNIQGSQRAIYLSGEVDAIVRFNSKGGDLITLQDGTIWLTTTILEQWPEWVKASIVLQDGS